MELLKVKPEYQQILLDMEDEKIVGQGVVDALDSTKDKFKVKADNIACMIKNLRSEEKILLEYAKKFAHRSRIKDALACDLSEYLEDLMWEHNTAKMESPHNNIRLKAESELIIDEEKFIEWAQKDADHLICYMPPFVKTDAVKEEIKAGKKIPYIKTEETERLEIE